ncbi:MAG: 50S ribosomal protein L11 methyltransferase [Hyphomicrobiales bacterium]
MTTALELRSRDLPRARAHALADALENAAWPEAGSVTLSIGDETQDLWNVVAIYEEALTLDDFAPLLEAADVSAHDLTLGPLPDVDWVRRSLEGLPPVHAGRFCLYGSHDRDRRPPSGVALEIDAGTAFGTGHHATTTGCLLALDGLLAAQRPKRVLDVGCGTGVLAIAAARACPTAAVTASDIDPEAVRVTRANARLNQAAVQAVVANGARDPRIERGGPYDLIFANILARPLAALAAPLTSLLARGGVAVLSGLRTDQEAFVLAAWRGLGAVVERKIHIDGWSTLVLRKPQGSRAHPVPKRLMRVLQSPARYPRRRALP